MVNALLSPLTRYAVMERGANAFCHALLVMPEDTFGADDNDWAIYREIVSASFSSFQQ